MVTIWFYFYQKSSAEGLLATQNRVRSTNSSPHTEKTHFQARWGAETHPHEQMYHPSLMMRSVSNLLTRLTAACWPMTSRLASRLWLTMVFEGDQQLTMVFAGDQQLTMACAGDRLTTARYLKRLVDFYWAIQNKIFFWINKKQIKIWAMRRIQTVPCVRMWSIWNTWRKYILMAFLP